MYKKSEDDQATYAQHVTQFSINFPYLFMTQYAHVSTELHDHQSFNPI
jgi:hypothetical protein